MHKDKLKPCPFCGDKAEVNVYSSGGIMFMVRCAGPECPVSPAISRHDRNEAIMMWNHRACDGDKGHWVYTPNTNKDEVTGFGVGSWHLQISEAGEI